MGLQVDVSKLAVMKGSQITLTLFNELIAKDHEGTDIVFKRMSAYHLDQTLQQLVK
jgi:hypothetical protein